jgi:hypothetical protein
VATAEGDTHADATAGRLSVCYLLLGQGPFVFAELVLEIEVRAGVGIAYVVSHS